MPNKNKTQPKLVSNFIVFKSEQGKVKVNVIFKDETLWLTQKMLSQLFAVEVNTINYHLKEIFRKKVIVYFKLIKEAYQSFLTLYFLLY